MALVPCEIRLKRGEVSPRKAGGCWGQDDEGGEHGEAEDVKVAQACPTLGIFPTQGSNPGLPHCKRILYQLSHQGSCALMMGWFPCTAAVLGSPNAQGKPAQHIHLPLGGRRAPGKAWSDRRFLGTNGATLWLWSCLPKPGAPGP